MVCVCVCGGRGGGRLASVMSAEGDHPMLINAHSPSLRSLFELWTEQRNHGVLWESINHNCSSEEYSNSGSRSLKTMVLKTLKCPTAYRPQTKFLSERVKCPIKVHVVKRSRLKIDFPDLLSIWLCITQVAISLPLKHRVNVTIKVAL